MTAYVHVAPYEPEHEVAEKLLDLAREQGFEPAVVTVSRDDGLVFGVPNEVGDAFADVRGDLWQDPTLVDDDNNPDTPPVRRRGRPPKNADQE